MRSLRHVVLSVAHKLRTVHEMRDNQYHVGALNKFVVTSCDTLEINFLTFQNFCHDMTRSASSDPHHYTSVSGLLAIGLAALYNIQ